MINAHCYDTKKTKNNILLFQKLNTRFREGVSVDFIKVWDENFEIRPR